MFVTPSGLYGNAEAGLIVDRIHSPFLARMNQAPSPYILSRSNYFILAIAHKVHVPLTRDCLCLETTWQLPYVLSNLDTTNGADAVKSKISKKGTVLAVEKRW